MERSVIPVNVDDDGDQRLVVRAPIVGWWSEHPAAGTVVGPGSPVGLLTQLNRQARLVLPDGAAGRVVASPETRIVGCEFGQTMFHLARLDARAQTDLESKHLETGHPGDTGLPAGCWAVIAPTDGVFYVRSAPDAPPFAKVGDRIRSGQPVGLVEVMKTFNQIQYGGPGLPDEVEVVDVRCGDGVEVSAGQVLMVVR